ncbi:hypothetical protein ACFL51_01680 [Myxococcota bacterium]
MPEFTGMDHVMMRSGTSYVGKVTRKKFHIAIEEIGGQIDVKTKNIIRIEFRHDYGMPLDEIVLRSASKLRGTISDEHVAFQSEELGKLNLKVAAILAIQLHSNMPF